MVGRSEKLSDDDGFGRNVGCVVPSEKVRDEPSLGLGLVVRLARWRSGKRAISATVRPLRARDVVFMIAVWDTTKV